MSGYEGKMARSSLRKTCAYATELLTMIKPTDELEPWIQAKISDMDHYIESVYSYYKFGESEEMEEDSESEMEDDSESEMEEDSEMSMNGSELEGKPFTIMLTP